MKTTKRVIAIISIIILAFVVGYLVYTGSRLMDVLSEANIKTTESVVKGALL